MKILPLVAALPIVLFASACTTMSDGSSVAAPTATAKLVAGDGVARGMATVTEAGDGLNVLVKAQGLTPGIHAVHIHMTGQCVGPDFTSAGGHWNPTAHKHGKDNPAGPHMGDMPNMTVGPDGRGAIEYQVPGGLISGGATPMLDADGAAIVVHAQADDYKTDPTGNAGGRIACGVVTAK